MNGARSVLRSHGPVRVSLEPAGFAGRRGLVDDLLKRLAPAPEPAAVVLAGMAGVGKTALALHAVHRMRELAWFPGGILMEDLRGFSVDGPIDHGTAVTRLLRALGTPDADVPVTPDERVRMWWGLLARLADEQRPLLLVLDNVATAGQVAPLLPGSPHRVLLTSRNTLSALSAARIENWPAQPGRVGRVAGSGE